MNEFDIAKNLWDAPGFNPPFTTGPSGSINEEIVKDSRGNFIANCQSESRARVIAALLNEAAKRMTPTKIEGGGKHTPGPWGEPDKSSDGKRIFIEADGDGWHSLRVEVDSDDCDRDTAMANARLIAAAPEMFAALKGLLGNPWLADSIKSAEAPDASFGDSVPEYRSDCEALMKAANVARAAIAKVEGKP